MKNLTMALAAAAVCTASAADMAQGDVWALAPGATSIVWRVGAPNARLPHHDDLEMSGRRVSVLFGYGVDAERRLNISRQLVWPWARVQPNDTHGSLIFAYAPEDVPALTVDGKAVRETVSEISFDGVWTSVGADASGLRVERRVFPSAAEPAAFERWLLRNDGQKAVSVGVTVPERTWIRLGCTARYVISVRALAAAPLTLAPGESAACGLVFSVRRASEVPAACDAEAAERGRRQRIAEIASAVCLESGDPLLDAAFRFAKIRAGEAIFDTAGGVFPSPGGGRYYAATWCNDQAEYAGPWFAMTGDPLALEASMNAYRHYLPFMADDYQPIPSSVIAEGRDYWNGAGDRGDAAMWAYGAARFVLATGRRDWAKELLPGLRWTLEYCRRKTTAAGVVASDRDELEGRLPAGSANLQTSCLCYDALRHVAIVERAIGEARRAAEDEARAAELASAIERHFGAEIHGFRTYRYYEGCTVLRSWIGTPLCMGLFDRAEGTAAALLSPYLRTKEAGLLSAEGDANGVTWDRSQLYAFRGIFAAGLADRAWADFVRYSRTRLLGAHVPYPVEAWPEGGRRHLSAESALYCRAVVEGLFGLEPTGFGTFRANVRLPKGAKPMVLRNVRIGGRAVDVSAKGDER